MSPPYVRGIFFVEFYFFALCGVECCAHCFAFVFILLRTNTNKTAFLRLSLTTGMQVLIIMDINKYKIV